MKILLVAISIIFFLAALYFLSQSIGFRWVAEGCDEELGKINQTLINERQAAYKESIYDCPESLIQNNLIQEDLPIEDELPFIEDMYYNPTENIYEPPPTIMPTSTEKVCAEWVGFRDYKECLRYK